MNNIKQLNRQFYKYWKKESLEWRPALLFVWKQFSILKKLSKLSNKCIYELILEILESKSMEINDKLYVMNILGIRISDKEYRALLMIAGYYYHRPSNSYQINEERIKRVMNICDAAVSFEKEVEIFGISAKINEMKRNHYQKKRDEFERKFQKLELNKKINTMRIEPANGEREQIVNHILGKILFLVIISAVIILILYINALFNGKEKVDEIEISFWNSLLGACIPGVITIMTTYFLIKHEYKVDYHKERMSALPVFSFIHVHDKNKYINEQGKWNDSNYSREMLENTAQNDKISDEEVDLYILRNKGSGMAFNVSHDRKDEVFSFGDISQNEEKIIAMKKYTTLYYIISYMDIYGNKYTQRFELNNDTGRYNITTFPPELVLRTKLMRYQQ